jgi:hypothetical protein
MNHPDAVSKKAIPTFEITLADQMTVNAGYPKAPQRVGPGSISATDVVVSALKPSSILIGARRRSDWLDDNPPI